MKTLGIYSVVHFQLQFTAAEVRYLTAFPGRHPCAATAALLRQPWFRDLREGTVDVDHFSWRRLEQALASSSEPEAVQLHCHLLGGLPDDTGGYA